MSALDDLAMLVIATVQAGIAAASAWEIATVIDVEPQGAADGFDLVTVDWDGAIVKVGRGTTYTPEVGHVVWMARKGHQLMIVDRYVGSPYPMTGSEGDVEA